MPFIMLENCTKSSEEHRLFHSITTIGSSPENEIVCNGPGIGAEHAQFIIDEEGFWILPLSPRKYEVYVNGDRVKKKTAVHYQDRIRLGELEGVFTALSSIKEEPVDELTRYSPDIVRKLQVMATSLSGNYTVGELLNHMMDEVISLVDAERGFIVLIENGKPVVRVARNFRQEDIVNEGELSDSIIRHVIKTQEPLIIKDAFGDAQYNAAESVIRYKLSSVMCVPLKDRNHLIGIIYVGNKNCVNVFQARHLEMLKIFAAQMTLILANAMLVDDLTLYSQKLKTELKDLKYGEMIGNCPAMLEVRQLIDRVAPTDVPVLIEGETGTGKELVANEVHQRSKRMNRTFVAFNCGALSPTLIESQLFGHKKGAFTGADRDKIGLFKEADGGTIFLDEIGEIPLELQVKLLRVLQEHTIMPIGATKPEHVDIRIIAATNRILEDEVKEKRFREDLFYRLNVITIKLPPLRERGEDIVSIAKSMIERECTKGGYNQHQLSVEAEHALRNYSWPGNIRELLNKVIKALIMADNKYIMPKDLELEPEYLKPTITLGDAENSFRKRYVLEALARNNNNKTKTAKELDITTRTLYRILDELAPEGEGNS